MRILRHPSISGSSPHAFRLIFVFRVLIGPSRVLLISPAYGPFGQWHGPRRLDLLPESVIAKQSATHGECHRHEEFAP